MSENDIFDHRGGALIQLQMRLGHGVSNAEFTEITDTIRSLTLSRLNADRQARHQLNELSGIEDSLRRYFPAIFDSTNKLTFAKQLAMQYHRSRRTLFKSHHTNATQEKAQPIPGPREGCNSSKTQRSQPYPGKSTIPGQKQATSTRTLRRRAKVDNRALPSGSSGSEYTEPGKVERDGGHPPQRLIGDSIINKPSRHSAFVDSESTKVSACEPIMINPSRERYHPTTTTSSSWTSDATPSHSVSYIHRFLQTCSPSQGHLLSRFIDVGFRTPAVLKEVAEKWTTEERRELMKRIAPGLNGEAMTELELAALERGFQALRSTI